jgi:hypothetical protein
MYRPHIHSSIMCSDSRPTKLIASSEELIGTTVYFHFKHVHLCIKEEEHLPSSWKLEKIVWRQELGWNHDSFPQRHLPTWTSGFAHYEQTFIPGDPLFAYQMHIVKLPMIT